MPAPDVPLPLAVLGLSEAEEKLYRAVLRVPRMTRESAAALFGGTPDAPAFLAATEGLLARGLVLRAGDDLVAAPPERALAPLLRDEQDRVKGLTDRLAAVRGLLPELEAEHRRARVAQGEAMQIQAIRRPEVVPTVQQLTLETDGELLLLRPDQWKLPEARAADASIAEFLAQGGRCRAIYPARAMEEAPEAVRRRAELGERVRLLSDVPGRLAVVGSVAALVPYRFEPTDDLTLVLRQPALVTALTLMFESLWERALVVPGLGDTAGPADSAGRLLLDQLARGTKDEQIARTLGLSLRTVRRRVADLMDELDAASRFQAGVEAVRRGWL